MAALIDCHQANLVDNYSRCEGVGYLTFVVDLVCHIGYVGVWFSHSTPVMRSSLSTLPVFDCLRVWAITQHRSLPPILVFVFGIFDSAINVVSVPFRPQRRKIVAPSIKFPLHSTHRSPVCFLFR